MDRNVLLTGEVRGEWSLQKDYGNSISSLRHNMSNHEADDLQQQNTALGFSPVSQEQKSEAGVGTGSLKLDC